MSDGQPDGYCPRCGYPINPGTCSECGTVVTEHELRREPLHVRRRRIRRRIALVVLLAGVVGATYWGYRTGWLIRYTPTTVLLWLQPVDESVLRDPPTVDPISAEILLRHTAGRLSPAQVTRMYDQALIRSANLGLPDRFPAGVTVPVQVRIDKRPGFYWMHTCYSNDVQIHVDGQRVVTAPRLFSDPLLYDLSPLSAGTHVIRLSASHTLHDSKTSTVLHTWPIEISQTVFVEDKPISEYIRPRWSDDLAAEMTRCTRATLHTRATSDQSSVCTLSFSSQPVCVAGELWFRPSGTDEWTALGEGPLGPAPFLFQPQVNRTHSYGGWCTLEADAYDLRFVPRPDYALTAGMQEYFAGTMEWDAVEHTRDADAAARVGRGVPPTRVLPPAAESPTHRTAP